MPQKKRGQTPVEEAVARILNALDVPEKTEEIPLLQALGRVAAGDVCARVAQPPFDRSALDGYALRAADIAAAGPETPVTLPVSRYLCAGSDPGRPLAPGTAARIMTGAPVPAGADCVLRQEDTESNGQTVTFHAPVEARANVCFAGEDIAPGKCLVPAGTRLDEVTLGLLAGQGVQTVTVYAKPRAALMPTGDELCSPETPLRPGKIYDSNGPLLAARMLRLGAEPTLLAAGPDDPAALAGVRRAGVQDQRGCGHTADMAQDHRRRAAGQGGAARRREGRCAAAVQRRARLLEGHGQAVLRLLPRPSGRLRHSAHRPVGRWLRHRRREFLIHTKYRTPCGEFRLLKALSSPQGVIIIPFPRSAPAFPPWKGA